MFTKKLAEITKTLSMKNKVKGNQYYKILMSICLSDGLFGY